MGNHNHFNRSESSGTSDEALVMRVEQQPRVRKSYGWNAVCGESRTHGVERG